MYGGIINVIKTCFRLIGVVAVSGAVHLWCSSFAYSFCTASMVTLAAKLPPQQRSEKPCFDWSKTISNRESAIKRHVPHWKQNGPGERGMCTVPPGSVLVLLGIGAHKQPLETARPKRKGFGLFWSCFFFSHSNLRVSIILPAKFSLLVQIGWWALGSTAQGGNQSDVECQTAHEIDDKQ